MLGLTLSLKQLQDFPAKIAFIYIDNTSCLPIDELCERIGLRLIRADISNLDQKDRGQKVSEDLLSLLESHVCEYLFVFGRHRLKGPLLSRYRYRIVNFHPSLLPAFPGIKAIDKAIDYGSFLMGNNEHLIDESLDTGPIIMHNIVVVEKFKDYEEILDGQIPMIFQIADWLENRRIEVDGRKVRVIGASYKLAKYIPNLEPRFAFLEEINGWTQ